VAWGDYDNDGDLDLYVVNDHLTDGIINRLFRNNGNGKRWLTVKTVGTVSNKDGVGAKVTATTGSTTQRRDVDGGSGLWSQPSLPIEFGFGTTTTVDQLQVTWPSALVQTLSNVATNQTLTLTEPLPTITNISSTSAAPGASVTVTGTNFSTTAANNTVFFDPIKAAAVTAASATSLTVTVPNGAGYGPLSVTVDNRTAASKQFFLPTFAATVPGVDPTSYAGKADFPTGTSPQGIATGDMDGDGKPDLVTANNGAATISVLLNTSSTGGNPTFATKVDLTTGSLPFRVAIGDLDRDGELDIVTTNQTGNSISVFHNTGPSPGSVSFAAKVDFTVANDARGLALGDFDGDGRPDIAVGNYNNNAVSVFRNTSIPGTIDNNSFAPLVNFATANGPQNVVAGDVDGDGKVDLVAANWTTNNLSVLRNQGSPGSINTSTFATNQNFGTGTNPLGLAMGDVDGDGKLDLVASNYGGTASVLRNTSSGPGNVAFATKVDFAGGGHGAALGDVDGDGKPELVLATNGTDVVSVLRNKSTSGTVDFYNKVEFATGVGPINAAVVDLTGDGKPDLAVPALTGNVVSVFANKTLTTPLPTITSISATSAAPGASVTISGNNFSGTLGNNTVFFDPIKAVVTGASTNALTVTVPTGAGYGPLSATINGRTAVSKQFFLPTFMSTGLPGIGSNSFAAKVDLAANSEPYNVAVGDVDGDGKADLALVNYGANSGNTVSVFRNTGTAGTVSFAAKQDFTTGTGPTGVAFGDLDGDGKLDLVTANNNATSVSVFRNTSSSGSITSGSFGGKVDFTTGSAPYNVAVADVDGDGRLDLAATNYSSSNVSVFRNTSSPGVLDATSFAGKVDFTAGTNPIGIAAGDLDGDGKPDLAVANYGDHTVSVLRNTSSPGVIDAGSLAARQDFATGNGPQYVAIGDLDGDGKVELATANFSANTASVLRNTANPGAINNTSFATRVDFATGNGPLGVAMGDLDGDGKPELVVSNNSPNTVSVLRNTANPSAIDNTSFAAKMDFDTGNGSFGVAAVDLDGDGKPDLAVANKVAGTLSVLRNLDPPFLEVGAAAGVADTDQGEGVAWGDYDNDGDQDIYVVNYGSANRLHRNNGNGTFTEVGASAGVADAGDGNGAAWGDYDNDGDLDLYLANNGTNRLFRNDGSTGFSEVGAAAHVDDAGYGQGVSWVDYDRDGRLDLYVVNHGSANRLYHNEGGVFTEVGGAAGVADAGLGYEGVWGDYDNDGDSDLYLTNNGTNRLHRNDGGTFAEVGSSAGVAYAGHSTGAAWGDYDNDGKLDLLVSDFGNGTKLLYHNDGNASFSNLAGSAGVNAGGSGYGVAWGDYDNDGNLDLYLVNFGTANRLHRNNGNGGFTEIGAAAGVADAGNGVGAAWADYDNDGDLDLYLVNQSPDRLYRNSGNANRWLQVKLIGVTSNKSGVGAKVTANAGGVSQRRDVEGGAGFLSQGSLPVEFGFGGATTVAQLTVTWPSGAVKSLGNVATNQILTLNDVLTPAQLAFTTQPVGGMHGQPLAVQPVVEVRDPAGQRVYGYSGSVTLNPGAGGGLTGTATVAAVDGIAAFSGLGFSGAGTRNLVATANGVSAATSASFTVAKVPAAVSFNTNLSVPFNGQPRPVGVSTNPPGLSVSVGYNGAGTAPVGPGVFAVTAAIADPNYEGSASATFTIAAPPVARLNASAVQGNPPLAVNFSDASTGAIEGWTLESFDAAGRVSENRGQGLSAVYDRPGTYEAILTVRGPGGQSEARVRITVNRPPQVGTIGPAPPAPEDTPLELNLAGKDPEPGGWAVRGADPALIAKVEVQGDLLRFTPVLNAFGADEVEIVRTGVSGLAVSQNVSLNWTPVDDPPVILLSLPTSYTAAEDRPLQVGGSTFAFDVDTPVNNLVWSASGFDALLVASAVGGGAGVVFVPVPDANGQTRAQLRLRDPATGAEVSREINLTWTPVPDPPQASTAIYPAAGAREVPLNPVMGWAAKDPDEEPLRYSLFLAPAGQPLAQVAGDLGQAQYVPATLRPNTTYAWKVVVRDPTGNTAESSFGFTTQADRQPPTISGLTVAVKDQSATLGWNTDEPARGSVVVTPEAGGTSQSVRGENLAGGQSLTVTGLAGGTWYTFEAGAGDEAGNSANPVKGRFLTLAEVDLTPPRITVSPYVEGLTDQSAVIRWSTDELATGAVNYAETGGPSAAQGSGALAFEQQIRLSGLKPKTTYSYTVRSFDASNNPSNEAGGRFTTAAVKDLVPPRFVENPALLNIGDKDALVALRTDELCTAELRYDLDTDLGDGRLAASPGGTAHQFPLSGLTPGALYYYQARIVDESGNQTFSAQGSFQTRLAPDQRPAQFLEGPAVEGISENGGILVLRADKPVGVQVLLSPKANPGNQRLIENRQLQQRHSLPLSGLLQNTPYTYSATLTDAGGKQVAKDGEFRTAQVRDEVPPRFVEGPFAEGIGTDAATLAWRTDELATGAVQVQAEGGSGAEGRQQVLSTPAYEQRLQLTQLQGDTPYSATVSIQDAQGNLASARLSFRTRRTADTFPPRLITGPGIAGLSASGAILTLGYDEPAEVVLRYATNPQLAGAEVVAGGERRREHRLELRGLDPGTAYYGSAEASDAAGNSGEARSFSFTTPAGQDRNSPVFVAGPVALALTQEGARIEWSLDEPGSGEVEIAAGGEVRRIGVLERRQRQGVEVGGLAASTTYTYRVRMADASGNEILSPERSFRTLGAALGPPVFTAGPAVPQVSQDQATIFWRTDQPTDAQVDYFKSSDPGEALRESHGRLDPDHTLVLTNLESGAEYSYSVSSRNAQSARSEVRSGTFRTKAVKDEKAPVLLGPPSVLSLQQDRVRIRWRTDELADSQVRFRDAHGTAALVSDPGATTDHVLDLTNLKPGTTYRYLVGSTDQAGNGPSLSGEETFTTPVGADQDPPQYTRWPTVKTRTANALVLSWTTSEASTAILEYGKTPQYELASLTQLAPGTGHEWHLGQLEPGQTYYLRVGAVDLAGNGPAYAPGLEVSTLSGSDQLPPAILTGPIVVQTTATSAVIEWSTDEVSDGQVEFSGGGVSDAAVDPEFNRTHQLVLTNLSPGQAYTYRVASRDVSGNGPTRSGIGAFTTEPEGQTPPPQITGGPTALEVGPRGATLVWHTDVPANTVLEYGTSIGYGQRVQQGALGQEHAVSLVGLAPATTYHFKVSSTSIEGGTVSTDPAGNTLYSLDHQFTTQQLPDQESPRMIRAPVVEWTDRNAVVTWRTDELSNSRVDWAWVESRGQRQESFVADDAPVRDHSLTLNNLKKRTSYKFQVSSVDASHNALIWGSLVEAAKVAPGYRAAKILQPPGGAGSFVTDNLPDTQPPVIIDGPRIREKTTQTLTVEWETDELADGFVRFGPHERLGEEVGQARDELVHRITLTNLAPGQRYYFQVASTDPSGNGATESGVALAATAAEVDLSPPRFVEEPRVLAAADDEAVIAWRTDEAASARVEYWIQGGEVLNRRTLERVADQRLALTNLKPDTEYLARVFATDASQNEARAGVDLRLRTDRLPDLSPPQLLGEPVVSGVSDQGAIVEWTTDELANSAVDYDLTPYLGEVAGDPAYTQRHRVVLTGLQPSRTYYFRAGSADLAGNGPTHSEVASFTTLSGADTLAPAAPRGLQVRAGAKALLGQLGGQHRKRPGRVQPVPRRGGRLPAHRLGHQRDDLPGRGAGRGPDLPLPAPGSGPPGQPGRGQRDWGGNSRVGGPGPPGAGPGTEQGRGPAGAADPGP
jgi:phosphodiesterase/alkaline phosphatase D-like protein